MPTVVCPICLKVTHVMPNNLDFICNCGDLNPDTFTAKEDIFDIGFFDDTSLNGKSGGELTNFNRGNDNLLRGTEAQAFSPNAKVFDLTARGRIKSLYRQRDEFTYIEVPKNAK